MSPKTQDVNYLQNVCDIFYYISVIYGEKLRKHNCLGGIFRKTTVGELGAQMRNAVSVETLFTSRTDFIFVRYSVTTNNNKFWEDIIAYFP
jgi:hypothetical protein